MNQMPAALGAGRPFSTSTASPDVAGLSPNVAGTPLRPTESFGFKIKLWFQNKEERLDVLT